MNGYYALALILFGLGLLVLSLGLAFDAGVDACESAHAAVPAQPVVYGYDVTVGGISRPLVRVIEF